MIAQMDYVPAASDASLAGPLARRLARALESKEVELAEARREIAELKGTRERDEQLRRLGEAQASLAHQIRTPLTVAGLHLDQLLLELDEERARNRVVKVRASLAAVERQIKNALVFVTGRLGESAEFDAYGFVELLHEHLALLESVHPITWNVAPLDGARLDGDRAVLAGAVVNLVENAVAVGGSRVKVTLGVRLANDRLVVIVEDDGPGMSHELLSRARVPFVSERAGGSGFGLAIADRVVAAHGGTLRIESRLGEGTRIDIVVPTSRRDRV